MNYCYRIPHSTLGKVHRIVVVGDIHGDWNALIRALVMGNLINGNLINGNAIWIGGRTHLVQLGDFVDRRNRNGSTSDERSESRIIKFLVQLKGQAQKKGGDVHILLGNHELMNVMGDFRYVSPMGMGDFNSNRKAAFQPGGTVAQVLACNASSIIKIGSWVFTHAGISPVLSHRYEIDEINKLIREFLLGNTKMDRDHPVMDIFWNRQHGDSISSEKCAAIQKGLGKLGGRYMAVGHTVQDNINAACNGKVWRVDTGMSGAFNGDSIQVLEIIDDGAVIRVLY